MKRSRLMALVAPTLHCLLALITLAQYGACLQQVAPTSAADSTAIMTMQQNQQHQQAQIVQQQQQQQSLINSNNNNNSPQEQHKQHNSQTSPLSSSSSSSSPLTKQQQTTAKSNHRLVSKLKDARHRRRHRHQRHRHRHHLSEKSAVPLAAAAAGAAAISSNSGNGNGNASGGSLNNEGQQVTVNSLTALESIVEEVARAGGQLPAASNQQQQQQAATAAASQQQSQAQNQQQPQQQQHQQKQQSISSQVTPAVSASEILLDGSSSPVSGILQQQASQSPQAQLGPVMQPLPPQIQIGTRVPAHNSRGFFLTSMLSKIMNVLNVTEFALEMRDGISSRASCMACNAVVGLFLSPLYSKEVFSAAIRTVCTSFKIQSARVCSGLVESFQDDFEYIRKNTKLTRDEVCAVVFGVDCARRQTYNLFWTVPIPDQMQPAKQQQQQQLDQTNLPVTHVGGLPMSEQALSNMDDAPDLFEYRRSNAASSANGGANSNSATNSNQKANDMKLTFAQASGLTAPNQPTSDQVSIEKHQSAVNDQQHQKAAKMMKRPEYIFDDELIGDNEQASSDRNANKISSFVHITDIHVDPYYEAGSLNDCNEPLCCRATSGPVQPGDKRRQAGPWGDYGNCDAPIRTIRSALNRIREKHSDAEYWIWTGDISPHDIWNISKSEASNNVRLVSKMVRDYSNGLPVFPVIGNHEAHPVNSFAPPEIKGKYSMSWLYDLLAEEWSDWLPKDALNTLRVGGFYKLQVRKGFRIIALNTNYCARLNPWSFYDPVDPANQLKWLVDELLEAEINQDKVHIIGHVPPDNRECTQAWLFNFINIIDRFKDTIVAQFYGHTHRDEWRIMYSLKRTDEPVGIQYIGPSITPFTENNPAYRVYQQDKSGHLLNSETYFFNLTEANESPASEPNWKFSYSTQRHLNMTQGLTANEWHQYLQRLHEDEDLFDSFFHNYYRSSDVKVGQVCRTKCKFQMLSDLRLTHPYKTKPKPFLANRKTSNHHRDRHDYHHHHHKRLRHSD